MQNSYDERDHVQKIYADHDKKFLSEVFTDLILPSGVLNKGKSGCGGTTVAIESPQSYIIFMPTIELINNKLSQYKEREGKTYSVEGKNYEISLLGVHGNVVEKEINDYIYEQEHYNYPIKILATYDSAYKLQQTIGDTFYTDYKILVDEMHSLMTEYSYRTKAIEQLLQVLNEHNRVTYMSATPIAPADGPIQLESLPRHEVIWPPDMNTKILLANTTNPICSVIELIYNLYNKVSSFELELNGEIYCAEEFFFYINSVTQISTVLEKLNEKIISEVNIVCADTTENRKKLGEHANLIGSTWELKKYNLLTKKAFVGCDIYSPLGFAVIVTDMNIPSNYLDLSIDVLQIIGRIRNEENPLKNYLLHLTNSNSTNRTNLKFDIKFSDGELISTDNASRYFRYRQKVHEKYKSIIDSYIESGLSAILGDNSQINEYCTYDKRKSIEIIYNTFFEGGKETDLRPAQKMLWEQNPEIKEVIDKFGVEKLKALSFKFEKIKKFLKEESPGVKTKIATKLKQKIKVGSVYTRAELSDILLRIYNEIGLEKTAKATDVKEYYEVRNHTQYNKVTKKNDSSLFIIDIKPI